MIGFYPVLLGFCCDLTTIYWVLPSFSELAWILLRLTEFDWVLPSFTGFFCCDLVVVRGLSTSFVSRVLIARLDRPQSVVGAPLESPRSRRSSFVFRFFFVSFFLQLPYFSWFSSSLFVVVVAVSVYRVRSCALTGFFFTEFFFTGFFL